jgi:hypothetical protein
MQFVNTCNYIFKNPFLEFENLKKKFQDNHFKKAIWLCFEKRNTFYHSISTLGKIQF